MDEDAERSEDVGWREKFDYILTLLRDPRFFLGDTLVAEQLKVTLKLQAYQLESQLLVQSIDENR